MAPPRRSTPRVKPPLMAPFSRIPAASKRNPNPTRCQPRCGSTHQQRTQRTTSPDPHTKLMSPGAAKSLTRSGYWTIRPCGGDSAAAAPYSCAPASQRTPAGRPFPSWSVAMQSALEPPASMAGEPAVRRNPSAPNKPEEATALSVPPHAAPELPYQTFERNAVPSQLPRGPRLPTQDVAVRAVSASNHPLLETCCSASSNLNSSTPGSSCSG